MPELKHPYISVAENGRSTYGGSQMEAESSVIRRCGCGPVAALDTLLYLDAYHGEGAFVPVRSAGSEIPKNAYLKMLSRLIKGYLPIIPPFGMNGLTLMSGMNIFFIRHKMPYKARWGVSSDNTAGTIEAMLGDDIPVIMAIGPNFPRFWGNHKLSMYMKGSDGRYFPASEVKAHFVTVTGIDADWLQISSWGRRYYLRRDEFQSYVKNYSINYLSSILYIQHK